MSGHIHWLKEIPAGEIDFYDKSVVITRKTFDNIADYTRSNPTGASPGRIWKKNLHWSSPPSNWFIYIADRDDDGGFYFGRPAYIVEDE